MTAGSLVSTLSLRPSRRRRAAFAVALFATACTPASDSFTVHSTDLTCDEANRAVYGAVTDMNMKVVSFEAAKPGRPGSIRAVSTDRKGDVSIVCDATGVHIDPHQATLGDKSFERGIFLSVTGRSGLRVDRGEIVGRDSGTTLASSGAAASGAGAPAAVGVAVAVQPQRGFEAVLDFDADLASAGILPIKISVRNDSSRIYDFAPEGVVVRVRGSGAAANRWTAAEAAARLDAEAAGEGTAVGNVASAKRIMVERELRGARLAPGAGVEGYVYYPAGDYDRAKLTMTDVGAGEPEAFLVEF